MGCVSRQTAPSIVKASEPPDHSGNLLNLTT
jgi:hypothetical protein